MAQDYERHKSEAAARQAVMSAAGRDIGPIPPVAQPFRRLLASRSLRFFAETYLPGTFSLAWSPDHLRAIGLIESAVRDGGLFGFAMPRGTGKSALSEAAVLWALLEGLQEFAALIGSTEGHAERMLESIKGEIEGNDLLAEDYPEVCYPIRRLDGIANRCKGQTCRGERTRIEWTAKQIVLPTIEGSKASGAVLRVAGLTGQIRGMAHRKSDGRRIRPGFVVLDDPQTDESAKSWLQTDEREDIIQGAVLGLAGPGRAIAGVMPCTVIAPGDLSERFLDRARHPEWQGIRTRMVYSFPNRMDLWDQYAQVRADGLRREDGGKAGDEFYAARRAEMDAGAEVAWPERHPGCLSALQYAMNLRIRDEGKFLAEFQNEPRVKGLRRDVLTIPLVVAKANGLPRGLVPQTCSAVNLAVDVQKTALFWLIAAWGNGFTGAVLDYGMLPEQTHGRMALATQKRELRDEFPGTGDAGAIAAGLERIVTAALGREWPREDGASLRIERALVDSGSFTTTVYEFCRRPQFSAILGPSKGQFIGPNHAPMHLFKARDGEEIGEHWTRKPLPSNKRTRLTHIDTNFWKSTLRDRLLTKPGDIGCLSLWGSAREHEEFASHVTAERPDPPAGPHGVEVWKQLPRMENHLLDCLVMAAVAASMAGVKLAVAAAADPEPAPRMSYKDYLARRRGE